jgi:carboxyl-terminal processing protease
MAEEAAACFMRLYYDLVSFSDETAYTDALIKCMVMSLDDKYAIYRTEAEYEEYKKSMSGSFGGIGITVRKNYDEGTVVVRRLVMDSPAERAGVLVGDLLHSVEGMPVTQETMEDAFSQFSGDIGEPVTFTVLRNGEILSFTILRENMENMTVSYSISEDKVAYIYVSSFKRSTYQYFKAAIEAATEAGAIGFIFDVRENPGGYLSSVLNVLDCFVPDGTELLSYGAENETPTAYVASDDDIIELPCVVICGGTTASAGEIFAAALRDYNDMGLLRVTLVGTAEATYGKGIMQSSYHLSDGSVITMTSAFYNPPSGVNYHGIGVIPDIVCEEEAAMEVARQTLFDLVNNK